MNLGILALTDRGLHTARRIADALAGAEIVHLDQGIRNALRSAWSRYDGIICIMATGIVVRCLSGLARTKYEDPCVIVVDEKGDHAISLLSGHIGGGNSLAVEISRLLGGTPVITTGSDVSSHTSVDLWAIENNLAIINPERLAPISAALLNNGSLGCYQDRRYIERLPEDFSTCHDPGSADIVVSTSFNDSSHPLYLMPRIRYIGCGCRKATPESEILAALDWLETEAGIALASVAGLASIDLKRHEKGLLDAASQAGLPLTFFTGEELAQVDVPSRSEKVFEKVGTHNVCEAAALKAAGNKDPGRLIMRKKKWTRITMAVAEVAP
jgi:cobalt-precorrin 5A hydrolase